MILSVLIKVILPPVAFFLAARDYFDPLVRILVNSVTYAFIVGVFGTILANGAPSAVPLPFVIGFVQMAVGMSILEWATRRPGF
ncbi:hypothetical protein [Acidisphaera sp. S103]|uniref:hypothetical protein n=1 Tax=Acidisphaera sp. S103 TaxID=1747223 RepID=UPI00131B9B75|nr:hypothetical protein [Acidisphaera sp. S103]